MISQKLKNFLQEHKIKYVTIEHSPAYTAAEIAHSAHISGKNLVKAVIVKLDAELAMVVLSANKMIDLEQLKRAANATKVEIATEREFQGKFPDCEVGAMPIFGNLFDMKVYADKALSQDKEIAFNAGTHSELIKMTYKDFESLVNPKHIEIPSLKRAA